MELIFNCVIIAAVCGYIMNIVELVQTTAMSGMVMARAVGVFLWPIGCVLGFI